MTFLCPLCRATMSANLPQPGRFVIKCPHCGKGFVLRLDVLTQAAERAEAELHTNYAALTKRAADLERALATARNRSAANFSNFVEPSALPAGGDRSQYGREAASPQQHAPDLTVASAEASLPPAEADDGGDDESAGFPGYEVLKRLGRGGMGSVFLARQKSLDRHVAVKTLNVEWGSDPAFVSRFVREAYAAAQLTHHNVVQIYELGQGGGVNFFSMEFVPGGSLGDRLKKAGRLPPDEAVAYAIQAANGLRFAHDRGMVHRDIKPDNLMVNGEGVVKVADLGLVKTKGVPAEEDAAGGKGKRSGSGSALGSLPDVTRAGSAMGSPSYMAPEQCRDATRVDGRADIYSLGCTLYALIAGRAPFQGETAIELMHKHVTEPPLPLTRVAPDVPRELSAVVDRALAKDPAKRFQSMGEFISALKRWQQSQGLAVGRPTDDQLAAFEEAVRQTTNEPLGQWTARVGLLGPPVGVLVGLIALTMNPILGGVILLGTAAAAVAGFVTAGVLTRSHLFGKVREWAFGARLADWLTAGAVAVLFFIALYLSGLLAFGVVGLVLGAAAGVAYGYALAKPAHDRATETKDELESLAKRWRLGGMDEDEVRRFIVQNSGDRWERVYELMYGYPALLLARTQYPELVAGRPKADAWRDAIVARLEAVIRRRSDERAKRLLKKTEAERLKAEGIEISEAMLLADDAAEDVVEQGKAIQAANADGKKRVNVREMMSRYEQAKSIPRRPRTPLPVRVLKQLAAISFDPRLRLLVGAVLIVGGLMWLNQNTAGAVEGLKEVGSGDQASAAAGSLWEKVVPLALNPEQWRPLAVNWLPAGLTAWFDSLNPIIAGLLVLLSGLSSRTSTVLAVVFGAAVAFAAHPLLAAFGVTLPDLGPVKMSHVTALVGLFVGVGAFFFLRRK